LGDRLAFESRIEVLKLIGQQQRTAEGRDSEKCLSRIAILRLDVIRAEGKIEVVVGRLEVLASRNRLQQMWGRFDFGTMECRGSGSISEDWEILAIFFKIIIRGLLADELIEAILKGTHRARHITGVFSYRKIKRNGIFFPKNRITQFKSAGDNAEAAG